MNEIESPYNLDNTLIVPAEHRLFLNYVYDKHYCYGANLAYEIDDNFRPIHKRKVQFPFHAIKTSWYFYSTVQYRGVIFGVVNRSLYILS